jgi:Tol biopolymer transport system component/DNA-binding winged helix-turn-helix (wHTH) protein
VNTAGERKYLIFRFSSIEVQERELRVLRDGEQLAIEPKAFKVLVCLLRKPRQLVPKDDLIRAAWGDTAVTDNSLSRAIAHLRRVLEDDTREPRFIETVSTAGYRFVCPVEVGEEYSEKPDVPVRFTEAVEGGPRQVDQSSVRPDLPARPRRSHSWQVPAATILAALGVLVAYWLLRSPAPPTASGYAQVTNDGRSKVAPVNLYNTIATDGSRLYFGEFSGGHWSLAQVSATGGETAIMSTPFDLPQLADISPDRSELLVANFTGSETDAPLWTLSVPAGTPRRLGNLIGHDGTWSPDGKLLAYANRDQLNVARADGSDSHTLVIAPGPPLWIRWSPDGKALRFTLADRSLDALLLPHASAGSLWEISADGRGFHRLLQSWNNPPAECCGNWTPDGKYFFFQANRNEKTDIWATREKGFLLRRADREPMRVTAGQIDSRTPVLSVDGKKLFVTGVLPRGELSIFDPKSQQFVPFLSGISVKDVSFSADRKWIAYIAYPQGTLWRSRFDGQDRLQLTSTPMQAVLPRWSPDGRQIAFHAFVPGKSWQIYTIAAEGGNPLQVAPADHSEADPDWSPDGNSLVFGSLPWLEISTPKTAVIYILSLTTRRISILPGSQGLFSPHWSPNGRCIAALSSDSQSIMLFDLRTQKWSELARIVGAYPIWSHDGQYLYFEHPGSQPVLMRVRVQDRKIEQLFSLQMPRFRPWSWFALTPDDVPILMRDVGAQEIYALDLQLP